MKVRPIFSIMLYVVTITILFGNYYCDKYPLWVPILLSLGISVLLLGTLKERNT